MTVTKPDDARDPLTAQAIGAAIEFQRHLGPNLLKSVLWNTTL